MVNHETKEDEGKEDRGKEEKTISLVSGQDWGSEMSLPGWGSVLRLEPVFTEESCKRDMYGNEVPLGKVGRGEEICGHNTNPRSLQLKKKKEDRSHEGQAKNFFPQWRRGEDDGVLNGELYIQSKKRERQKNFNGCPMSGREKVCER